MEKLNEWLSLFANLGVLAGIVFLAYEIQVNTAAVSTDSATGYISSWTELTSQFALNPEIVGLMRTVNSEGWLAVSPDERARVSYLSSAQYKSAEFAHFQWRQGDLDHSLWQGNNRGLYLYLSANPWMRESWLLGLRGNFSAEFQEYVDRMVADICDSQECRDLPGATPQLREELVRRANAWSARFDP